VERAHCYASASRTDELPNSPPSARVVPLPQFERGGRSIARRQQLSEAAVSAFHHLRIGARAPTRVRAPTSARTVGDRQTIALPGRYSKQRRPRKDSVASCACSRTRSCSHGAQSAAFVRALQLLQRCSYNCKPHLRCCLVNWSGWTESNRRESPPQTERVTTTLHPGDHAVIQSDTAKRKWHAGQDSNLQQHGFGDRSLTIRAPAYGSSGWI
jgi:hypothetical protein